MKPLSELPLADLHALREELKRQESGLMNTGGKLFYQVQDRLYAVNLTMQVKVEKINFDK